jgi:hypothetical protein
MTGQLFAAMIPVSKIFSSRIILCKQQVNQFYILAVVNTSAYYLNISRTKN